MGNNKESNMPESHEVHRCREKRLRPVRLGASGGDDKGEASAANGAAHLTGKRPHLCSSSTYIGAVL